MTANGRGNMRPQSRSPPFLLTGLVVALVILGANYWNLSSSNASLSAEVADLQDQIRILSSKKINSERKNDNAMLRIRDIEKNVNDRELELTKLKTELKEVATAKETCTSKLRQNEDNVNGLKQELDTYKEKLQKIGTQTESKSPNCDEICTEKKRELFGQMEKLGFIQALHGLSQNGVDILDFKEKISSRQGSQNQKEGQQLQHDQNQQQQQNEGQKLRGNQKQQQLQQQGAQQNNLTRSAGLSGNITTLSPGMNKTSTKKPQRPATGSIMDVKFGSGNNQKQDSGYIMNANQSDTQNQGTQNKTQSGDTQNQGTQNKTQSGLDTAGKINFKARDDLVVDGMRKVLPSAKVKLMSRGKGVVEMQEKNGGKQGVVATTKKAQTSGKLSQNEVDEYDEEIDDKANDNNPKEQNQLEPPKKGEQAQKDQGNDYDDEEDEQQQHEEVGNKDN